MSVNKSKCGLVSIGIPTFNRPAELENILKIITGQTFRNIEIIISDNASPGDAVTQIAYKYSKLDTRVKYFRQSKNIGILKNYVFVLQQSSGEYFTCVSDDDWRSPEFIEEVVNLLEKDKQSNFAFCDYHEIYEDGCFASEYPFSHVDYFKPFSSKNRLKRILTHYWQNQKNGKCNLFYSLFRREKLIAIDFEQLSNNFSYLGMDNQIVFKMLQLGPVVISNNAMCCLTCKNTKYYLNNQTETKRVSLFTKTANLVKSYVQDLKAYLSNTTSSIEKLIISIFFIPKIISEILGIFYLYFNKIYKQRLVGDNFKRPSLKNSSPDKKKQSKLQLSNVTLVTVDTRDTEEALQALLYSSQYIDFAQIKLLSSYTPFCKDKRISIERIPHITNIDDWCHFIVFNLHEYIQTDFVLLIHADGFVVNPAEWRPEFLEYDYIGSPWPLPSDDFSYRDISGNVIRVGNSVSIRSKKILELPSKLNIPWVADHGFFNEDGFLCCTNRHILEANGVRYAPIEVAKYFAHECMIPEIKNITPFAFHKWMGTNRKYPRFR
jgi:glycosyltransferase involved in cell wall biosynthesis